MDNNDQPIQQKKYHSQREKLLAEQKREQNRREWEEQRIMSKVDILTSEWIAVNQQKCLKEDFELPPEREFSLNLFLNKMIASNKAKEKTYNDSQYVLQNMEKYNKEIPAPKTTPFENPEDRYERIHKAQPITYLNYQQDFHVQGIKDKIHEVDTLTKATKSSLNQEEREMKMLKNIMNNVQNEYNEKYYNMHLLRKQYELQIKRHTDAVNTKNQSQFQHSEAVNKLNATKAELDKLKALENEFLGNLQKKANNVVDSVSWELKGIAEQDARDEDKVVINENKKKQIIQLEQKGQELFKQRLDFLKISSVIELFEHIEKQYVLPPEQCDQQQVQQQGRGEIPPTVGDSQYNFVDTSSNFIDIIDIDITKTKNMDNIIITDSPKNQDKKIENRKIDMKLKFEKSVLKEMNKEIRYLEETTRQVRRKKKKSKSRKRRYSQTQRSKTKRSFKINKPIYKLTPSRKRSTKSFKEPMSPLTPIKTENLDKFKNVRLELINFFKKHPIGPMHLIDKILQKYEQMQIIQSSLCQRFSHLSGIKQAKKQYYKTFEVKLKQLEESLQLKGLNQEFLHIFAKRRLKKRSLTSEIYTQDSGMFKIPFTDSISTINQIVTSYSHIIKTEQWQNCVSNQERQMFMFYMSLFEQFYRAAMLIADIKEKTKGTHFPQRINDAHSNSFDLIVRQGRHPITQLKNIKKVLKRKIMLLKNKKIVPQKQRKNQNQYLVKQLQLVKPYLEKFEGNKQEITEWKQYMMNDMVILKFITKQLFQQRRLKRYFILNINFTFQGAQNVLSQLHELKANADNEFISVFTSIFISYKYLLEAVLRSYKESNSHSSIYSRFLAETFLKTQFPDHEYQKSRYDNTAILFDYQKNQCQKNQQRIMQIKQFYDCFDASEANDFTNKIKQYEEEEEDVDGEQLGDILQNLQLTVEKKAAVISGIKCIQETGPGKGAKNVITDQQFFDRSRAHYGEYVRNLDGEVKEEKSKQIIMTKQSVVIEKEARHYETIYNQTRLIRKKIFNLNARGKQKTVFNQKIYYPKIIKNYVPEKVIKKYLGTTENFLQWKRKPFKRDKKHNMSSMSTYSIGSFHIEQQLWSDKYYQKKTRKQKLEINSKQMKSVIGEIKSIKKSRKGKRQRAQTTRTFKLEPMSIDKITLKYDQCLSRLIESAAHTSQTHYNPRLPYLNKITKVPKSAFGGFFNPKLIQQQNPIKRAVTTRAGKRKRAKRISLTSHQKTRTRQKC